MTTRNLPCQPIQNGKPTFFAFTGFDVGQFFIHKGWPDEKKYEARGNWTVTHTRTGFSIKKRIRSKEKAIWLAKQLDKMDCWDFEDPSETKNIPSASMDEVRKLVGLA